MDPLQVTPIEDRWEEIEPGWAERILNAVISSDTETLEALINQSNEGINTQNSYGLTALHLAVFNHSETATEILLNHGADIEATAPDGRRPLYLAVEQRCLEVTQTLLRHGAVPDAEAQGLTPLHAAVLQSDLEMCGLLLEYGADVSARNHDGREPLFLAVNKGNANIIKLLLDHHADPDSICAEDPPTALHLACDNGKLEVIEVLLEYGASINSLRDLDGGTPLFRAVASGSVDAVRLLLQRGAKTHVWGTDGQSVLDLAKGNEEMLQVLQGERILLGPRIRNFDEAGGVEQPSTGLRPPPPPAESDRDKAVACHGFDAITIDFFTAGEHEKLIPKTVSVYDLLYSHGPEAIKSRLDGNEPNFTWYHLPTNNMVWVESLVRRLAAEKGGISAESYDNARSELELLRSDSGKKPQSFATRFSAMRPHCRRVPSHNSFSLTGSGDSIVSFIPFLHFETFSGYTSMVRALESRPKKRPRPPGFAHGHGHNHPPRHPPPPPPGFIVGKDRPGSENGPAAIHLNSATNSSGNSDSTSNNDPPDQNFMSRMNFAFRSFKTLKDRLSIWHRQKPSSGSGSNSLATGVALERDLERQSVATGSNIAESQRNGNSQGEEEQPEPEVQDEPPSQTNRKSEPEVQAVLSNSRPASVDRTSITAAIGIQDFPIMTRKSTPRSNKSGISETKDVEQDAQDQDQPLAVPQNLRPGERQEHPQHQTPTLAPRRWEKKNHRHAPPTGNLHEYLIRGYFDPGKQGIRPRRTLDQYVYAHIETTSHRDDDQVVYRYTKTGLASDPKIIMVDQLWLWILGDDTVISCCPLRWNSWLPRGFKPKPGPVAQTSKQAFYIRWIANALQQTHAEGVRQQPFVEQVSKKKQRDERYRGPKENTAKTGTWPEINLNDPLSVPQLVTQHLSRPGRSAIGSVHDLASLITTCCVELLDPHRVDEDFLFFDFFERSIGQANEKVANYLREFKAALSEGYGAVMDIANETELMIEVDDILDELHTLKLVLTDQKIVVEDLNETFKKTANSGNKAPSVEMRTLENHLVRIEQMEQAAKKVDKSLHRLMDLKQKQASLSEALYARESAIDTARQGKTVIVFTVVTILFLPVSFIAAIFAINTNGFPLDADDKIPFDYLMKNILAIGLGLSIPLIVIAFNVDRIAGWLNALRDTRGNLWQWGIGISAGAAVFLAILGPALMLSNRACDYHII
ncbi:ankyrin repeat and protein kinase domain-containing protein [Colletotrichum orchidophilum]|uniref:Ankyrin repeat and protein kinase domain-containing protein n=1 Tax=Colletotrichum orchidophilum TaxID=1209926 RepID=A0A1G4BD23_9PEZI|nr:ankyrin repeat and protein kinase domain-containing protein [Colletotrichum orchidophilum]OHE99308.1 ankyrin repeat and protein kinase domain-containing protein [Colletotrichum orchidophilum]